MKFFKPHRRKPPRCVRREECVSPRSHWGPCQEWRDGKLAFVDDNGDQVEVREAPKKPPPDPADPFGWKK